MITVSERAKKEILKLVEEDDSLSNETAGFRFGIQGGGCSGFMYNCKMTNNSDKFDEVFEFELVEETRKLPVLVGNQVPDPEPQTPNPTVRVFVDKKSLMFTDDTHIDYKRALMGAGFQFINPNSTGTCGCGESFAV